MPSRDSFLASRSAPCLVRAKTRKEPCSSRSINFQQAEFAVLFDFVEMQLDLVDRLGGGADLDAHRVADVGFDQVLDGAFDGGGEEQGLAISGQGGHDALDGGQEAHVEHAVGFIQHQDVHVAESDEIAAQKIVETAGGGDQHLGAFANGLQLRVFADAADDDGGADGSPAAILTKVSWICIASSRVGLRMTARTPARAGSLREEVE